MEQGRGKAGGEWGYLPLPGQKVANKPKVKNPTNENEL